MGKDKKPNINIFKRAGQLGRNPDLLDIIIQEMDLEVKYDYATKLSAFKTGLSAFILPINLNIPGEPSIGKTYNVMCALQFLPQENIWYLGKLSPTGLIHDHGILIDEDRKEIDPFDKPQKQDFETPKDYREALRAWHKRLQKSRYLVDLHNKILVFLEAPHRRTFEMLLPILSHDKEEISYKITQKTSRGGLRTKHIIVTGWPSTIFLSTKMEFMADFVTRCYSSTPESFAQKFLEANIVTGKRFAKPWYFQQRESKQLIKQYIDTFVANMKDVNGVLIPYAEFLGTQYYHTIPRDMRDFTHFLEFVSVLAAFHFMQRPIVVMDGKKYVVALFQDFIVARDIFFEIFETTRTGIQQHVLNVYHKILVKKEDWTVREFTEVYNRNFKPRRASKTLRRYLETLGDIGYVDERENPEDKRSKKYVPLMEPEEIFPISPFFENILLESPELRESLKNTIQEYGHQPRFYIYHFMVDDVGNVQKVKSDDPQTLLQFFTIEKRDVCPYLKKALEAYKQRKKEELKTINEMGINENKLVFKHIPFGDRHPSCEFWCRPPKEALLICNGYKDWGPTPICDACKRKLVEGEVSFNLMKVHDLVRLLEDYQ